MGHFTFSISFSLSLSQKVKSSFSFGLSDSLHERFADTKLRTQ